MLVEGLHPSLAAVGGTLRIGGGIARLALVAASRMSEAIAMMAPAPAQMPSTAETIGCGQARIDRKSVV